MQINGKNYLNFAVRKFATQQLRNKQSQ